VDNFTKLSQTLFGSSIDALFYIHISIDNQSLQLIDTAKVLKTYRVSTASRGAGNRQNTFCTPLGWHIIADKIGADESLGTTFKARRSGPITKDLNSSSEEDVITSRILWLQGVQPGYNQGGEVDSQQRYIYIHGTAQEQLIGQAVSHGCVRMRNTEVIELFDLVGQGTPVLIAGPAHIDAKPA